ncbi:hypothetical protein RIF29_03681 [Crotalaria pallida]|uniref:Uncharacterized protein n=1 Tax=Crotalaria pallida TaxID=3830 RepID=A0AAN9P9F3_CROPI
MNRIGLPPSSVFLLSHPHRPHLSPPPPSSLTVRSSSSFILPSFPVSNFSSLNRTLNSNRPHNLASNLNRDSPLSIKPSLWHRVRLGKYKRDSDSLQREGENLQAVWSPDAKLIAILPPFSLIKLNLEEVRADLLTVHLRFLRVEEKLNSRLVEWRMKNEAAYATSRET